MRTEVVEAWSSPLAPGVGVATLSALLPRTVAYEDWRCPLDPALRQGAQLAGLLASLLSLALVPLAVNTGHPVAIVLAVIEIAVVIVFLATLVATNGLQLGSRTWHKVAYGLILTEAPQGFLVSVSVVAGVVAAVLAVVLGVIITFAFLAGLINAGSK